MPPKVKISEQAIVDAAIQIIREEGEGALHARSVAKALGCSVQPIFHNFPSMEHLRKAVYRKVDTLFEEQLLKGLEQNAIPFLGLGLSYIDFARREKNLFRLLFMSDEFAGKQVIDLVSNDANKPIISIIAQMTQLSEKQSEQIFLGIWLLVHGIASMLATNECTLEDEQISQLLIHTFTALKHEYSEEGNVYEPN
ncbi:TetR/AcrR family transcriptional regulator [Sphaerochaeta halotolerans]|jgi:AcrR family transcriptional regulator|uniref:TetR/AcrR family transcriptional regulator n=1 Tax=Sphaerochaeta halotolerans TaxID=2293840 RepID=A0A372MG86_9SPIR|nr:TetR/AcrR family transcriptional regulator [Sphaerochaeta halotolerans]MXI85919.1 TetR family transcriptional regulator [Sphaerochaeta halotolerans]RFU94306.1 TetR/AcrR family transcriptional regulator [Sphaerochaeta halotolerans]